MLSRTILIAALGITLVRCDSLESPLDADDRFVVESFHEVGAPLGRVRFSRAVDVDGVYDPSAQGIAGADVRIYLLAQDGTREQTFEYGEAPDETGVYEPVDPDDVLELRTYELEITHPDAEAAITSTTLTPGSFEILRPGLDEVVYQQQPQFEVGVSRSEYPDRQTIFVFSVQGLDPRIDNLTPLYYDFIDPLDADNDGLTEEEILEDVLIVESPPINEGNYEIQPDNTIDVKLPWLAVAFYGPTRTSISAIDQNIYDFIRSQDIQQGGSTLSPGEIPNVLDRIDGATGVFGAYARVEQEIVIREP